MFERRSLQPAEPEWFPAQVLWTSITTGTLVTVFPDSLAERRFVFKLSAAVTPVARHGRVEFIPHRGKAKPGKKARIVFRFVTKTLENMAKRLGQEFVNEFMEGIEWCYQHDYQRAENDASFHPRYRLVSFHEVKGQPVANPVLRCWETPVQLVETVHWEGQDLGQLQHFIEQRGNFTRYDRLAYQVLANGQWQNCNNPLRTSA